MDIVDGLQKENKICQEENENYQKEIEKKIMRLLRKILN